MNRFAAYCVRGCGGIVTRVQLEMSMTALTRWEW